jgi:hypothetical protein
MNKLFSGVLTKENSSLSSLCFDKFIVKIESIDKYNEGNKIDLDLFISLFPLK